MGTQWIGFSFGVHESLIGSSPPPPPVWAADMWLKQRPCVDYPLMWVSSQVAGEVSLYSDMLRDSCWQTLPRNLSGEGVAWFQRNLSGSRLAAVSSIRDRWCHIDPRQQHACGETNVGPELSEQLSEAFLWQCVQMFLVPRGWIFFFGEISLQLLDGSLLKRATYVHGRGGCSWVGRAGQLVNGRLLVQIPVLLNWAACRSVHEQDTEPQIESPAMSWRLPQKQLGLTPAKPPATP